MDHVRVKGNLTPRFIKNRLSPFLDALTGIQNAIDEIKQEAPSPVKIHEITWEGGSDDKEFWEEQSSRIISLDAAKEALSGLREAIDTLYEQPNNWRLQRIKARAVSRYTNFIYETVLHNYAERESESYDIVKGWSGAPIILHSSSIMFDALDDLGSLEDKKQELSHIIGLLKGEEND